MRTILICLFVASAFVVAEDGMPAKPEKPKHAQLERMKSLAGEWLIVGEDGEATEKVGVIYRVTAAGSAVIETIFPGSDHEMITMYYLKGDDLVLTHYCALGNQPQMKAEKKSADGTIRFQFDGGANIDPARDMHMHDALFTFVDGDHFTTSWTLWKEGKAEGAHGFSFARKPKD